MWDLVSNPEEDDRFDCKQQPDFSQLWCELNKKLSTWDSCGFLDDAEGTAICDPITSDQ